MVLRLENVVKTLKTDPCHIQFRLEIKAGIMEGPEPGNDHKSDKTPEGRKKKHYTGWFIGILTMAQNNHDVSR